MLQIKLLAGKAAQERREIYAVKREAGPGTKSLWGLVFGVRKAFEVSPWSC